MTPPAAPLSLDDAVTSSARTRAVAVVGSINADVTAYGSPLPRPGETVTGTSFSLGLGGKGANQAVAAARAGARTVMVGAVGDDVFADITLGALRDERVEVGAVRVVEGATGIAHIRVDETTGQNDIMIIPHANAAVTPDVATTALRSSDVGVVLLQLEIEVATVIAAAQAARELGAVVILDPAPAHPLPEEIWASVDVVTPNETEAEVLTGIAPKDDASAEDAGRWFTDRGAGAAVITLAERGVIVVRRDGPSVSVRRFPAHSVEVVDTTAAGDAFTGALGAALAAGTPWDDAVARAMASGALAVTRAGASQSLPTAAEVDDFLASLG